MMMMIDYYSLCWHKYGHGKLLAQAQLQEKYKQNFVLTHCWHNGSLPSQVAFHV